jgi:hypothetical protein
MIEGQFSRTAQGWIKTYWPGAFVRKNEARWQRGFPDLTVIHQGMVAFIECKILNLVQIREKSIRKAFTPIQLTTLRQLAAQKVGAFGWIYYPKIQEIVAVDFATLKYGSAPARFFRENFKVPTQGKLKEVS